MKKILLIALAAITVTGIARAEESETVVDSVAKLYDTLAEKKAPTGIELMPGVTAGVLVEIEATYEDQGENDSSDLRVATFELGIDAALAEGVAGHVLLLYEEDDTDPMDVDEAYIRLGETEDIPPYLQAGRQYLPFGAYVSHLISDPLTLELGEIRETAARAGYANEWVDFSVGAFNGDVDEENDDHINDVVAAVSVFPAEGIVLGVYWLSDMGDTDGLQDTINEAVEGSEDVEPIAYERVAGAGGFLSVAVGNVMLDGEYITALDDFAAGLLGEDELQPLAWNTETAVVVGEQWEFAVRCEGSDEFPGFPELQYGGGASYGFSDYATLAVEYLHGEFDEADDRDLFTAQVAVEF